MSDKTDPDYTKVAAKRLHEEVRRMLDTAHAPVPEWRGQLDYAYRAGQLQGQAEAVARALRILLSELGMTEDDLRSEGESS